MHDHGAGPAGSACGGRHGHDVEGVTARAERLCAERGLQFTRLRRDVLHAVAAEGRPLGAYDIAERMSAPGRRVAPVSVYRALEFLTENGLVHRIASRNAFVPCAHAHGEGADLVFMICTRCGGIDETTSPEIERQIGRTVAQSGFRPAGRILEVVGECGACLGRGAEAPGPA